MLENLHKISLTSIEKAPVIQPNVYSLGVKYTDAAKVFIYQILSTDKITLSMGKITLAMDKITLSMGKKYW